MNGITVDQLYMFVISAIIGVAISEIYKKLPVYELLVLFGKYQRESRLKELKIIKNRRHDDRHYSYELQKNNHWFTVLVVVAVANFSFLINYNFLEYPLWLLILGMLPTYVIEFIWLNKSSYIEDLVVYQKGNPEWAKRKQRKVQYKKRKMLKLERRREKLKQLE